MAYQAKPNSGSLFKNTNKTTENHPDYTGTWKDEDGKEWQLAAWVKEGAKGKFFSLSASERRQPQQNNMDTSTDDLPF